jgi:hypothetical protein
MGSEGISIVPQPSPVSSQKSKKAITRNTQEEKTLEELIEEDIKKGVITREEVEQEKQKLAYKRYLIEMCL